MISSFVRFNRFKYHEVLSSLYVNYGPLVKEKIGGRKTLVHVFHPDDIQKVRAGVLLAYSTVGHATYCVERSTLS